ncbi:MAG: hypothetical protein K0U98_23075 [Deltaproteobacteria bacterium]|nr:hypothetical protein [Deltaproteobacteria bacterium]
MILLRRRPFFPAVLLATMMGMALVLETSFLGGPQWLPKLPLGLCLLWLAARAKPHRSP